MKKIKYNYYVVVGIQKSRTALSTANDTQYSVESELKNNNDETKLDLWKHCVRAENFNIPDNLNPSITYVGSMHKPIHIRHDPLCCILSLSHKEPKTVYTIYHMRESSCSSDDIISVYKICNGQILFCGNSNYQLPIADNYALLNRTFFNSKYTKTAQHRA